MTHTIKDWFAATRYWSFPVSVMPVVVTFAYFASIGAICSWGMATLEAVLTVLGVMLLHSAGNVLSDWADYRKGVDNKEAFAVRNLVFGEFLPKEYLVFSLILFAAGSLVGLFLVFLCGLGVLWVGLAGVVLTALYSFFKYRALGDLDIFIIFSILIIEGTSFVLTGEFRYDSLVLAVPVGLITVSVLHANNTIDISSDGKAGIRTFAMSLGVERSCRLYIAYLIIPFVSIIASVCVGVLSPFSLLCLLAFIPAYGAIKAAAAYRSKGVEAMMGLDQTSAKLQLVFSGLLSIGLGIAALVNALTV